MFDSPMGGPFGPDYPNQPDDRASEPVSEAQKILQGLLAELPENALALVEKVGREIDRVKEQTAEQTALIRQEAEKQIAALESKTENRRRSLFQHAIEQLEPLQKDLFRQGGPVWGSDIYTSDSHLGTAAVHAGALEFGEQGVVRVSILDMTGMPIHGTTRNGVTTMDWPAYNVGFRVDQHS